MVTSKNTLKKKIKSRNDVSSVSSEKVEGKGSITEINMVFNLIAINKH